MTGRTAKGDAQVRADAELEQMRQNIASLRQQRLLALLGVAGAAIAFLVSNLDKLRDLFVHKPRVQVVSEDPYVSHNAAFAIAAHGAKGDTVVLDSVSTPSKWYTIEPGAYTIVASLGAREILRQDFTVEEGDKRSLVIPGSPSSTIRVLVRNTSGPIGPKSQLEFRIEASGNGYLWVLERRDTAFALIYPNDCMDDCDNAIAAGKGYNLPDTKNRAIFAGATPMQERLMFLVTSSPSRETALRLLRLFNQAIVTKAESGEVGENWGYQEVTYQIDAP